MLVVLVGGDAQRQQVVREASLVGSQPHPHVVRVAGRVLDRGRDVAGDRRAQRRRHRGHAQAEVAGAVAVELHAQLRLALLERGLHVHQAPDLPHRLHQLAREAVELVHLGPAHAVLQRLLAEGAGLGEAEGEPGHRRDRAAAVVEHLAEGLAVRRLELHVDDPLGRRPARDAGLADRGVGVVDVGQRLEPAHHLEGALLRLRERRARRGPDRHLVLAAVEVRHEVAAEDGEDGEARQEGEERDRDHRAGGAAAPSRAGARTAGAGRRTSG